MSVIESSVLRLPEPHAKCWNRAEYYRLGELGFFEGLKAELWEGEIMVMSPQGPLHYSSIERAYRVLHQALYPTFHVRMQGPLELGQHSEPEPDIAVVFPGDYSRSHPRSAFLIVEVSDSSLLADRTRKGSLYARNAIADYWIINLIDGALEVFRTPQPDAGQIYGHGYADHVILNRTNSVTPLCASQVQFQVADLLP